MNKFLPWIQLVDGRPFEPGNPEPEDFDIKVIAKALSKICRFGGHTSRFYSVAEHSIHVASLLPKEFHMYGLLHDAHEAYTGFGDVCNPVKTASLRMLERSIDGVIAQAFDLEAGIFNSEAIKFADLTMLATEKRDLLEPSQREWEFELPDPVKHLNLANLDGSPERVEKAFLIIYNEIVEGKNGNRS